MAKILTATVNTQYFYYQPSNEQAIISLQMFQIPLIKNKTTWLTDMGSSYDVCKWSF